MFAMTRAFTFDAARLLCVGMLATAGCAAAPPKGGAGGLGGSGGAQGGRDAGGDAGATGPSGLPIPPAAAAAIPQPSGTPGNLKVLDWAGFKSALTYTFDDAQPSQVEHYGALAATGVRMTFFITSGGTSTTAGFDATFTQAVRDGHEMGNHTVHHCRADLTACANGSAMSLDAELDGCTNYITSHFGQRAVWTAASPYGDTNYNAPAAGRFFLNRGVVGGSIAPNDNTDPFHLPCHAAVENETTASFNAATDAAAMAGRWLIMMIHTIRPTAAIWYAPIDISVITDSIAHAKSRGDVWIDSMVNVGAYWRGQKLLSSATPSFTGSNQSSAWTWTWTLPAQFPPGKYLRVTVDGGTLSQNGTALSWNPHGYYEIALDAGALSLQ